jgi:sporulation protein YlmC with PRC-barrel domain
MMKRLLMTTAAASLLALGSAAYAQNATTDGTTQPAQPPVATPTPPATNNAPTTNPATNDATGGAAQTDMNNGNAQPPAAATANQAPANPPPSDAVISAQADGQVSANKLIGMTVYNAQGDKIGTVHDILLDQDGKASGVVLSVGGLLGVGAKSVGLTWKEIDVQPDQQKVQVSYTKDQLEAAPDFKTSEQINSEMNAQQPAAAPASPAPAGSATGGTTGGSSTAQ